MWKLTAARRVVMYPAVLLGLALVSWPARSQDACTAPEAVCAARDAVFAISSPFDPLASAVLVAPGVLATNRHVVADETRIEVLTKGGGAIAGEVVPTGYAGDLVLVRVPGLEGAPLPLADAADGPLYAVGADQAGGAIRVHSPGHVLALPADGKPLARLHHAADSQPGNSGGALVDGNGRLVGIVTAGGEGRHDAIPVSRLAALEAASGPSHAAASAALGRAYRVCIESLERGALDALAEACGASGNRQLLDLAGRALGEAGRHAPSAQLFRDALEIDPNSVNSMIGLAVTLHLAESWDEEVAVLRDLIERSPADFQVLRMSVQAGKFAGDETLIERALAFIGQHHPDALDAANDFLAQ
jgi:hypothetical protein